MSYNLKEDALDAAAVLLVAALVIIAAPFVLIWRLLRG